MSCAMDEVFSEFFTSDKLDGFGPVNLLTTSWKCEQVKKYSVAKSPWKCAHLQVAMGQ
jgi:hypothetical protein